MRHQITLACLLASSACCLAAATACCSSTKRPPSCSRSARIASVVPFASRSCVQHASGEREAASVQSLHWLQLMGRGCWMADMPQSVYGCSGRSAHQD